ncbi:MAG TPA: InlB B-repeat-containing protein [Candidatus Blautia faecigallinarum]|uniref:InlB B-repeat-containing protein n=1 Tax=Candidatus Blautia faecigallinarum TaxID=2838488 RepID=A0A9D2DTT5_9FIRM|nr:InlB B-repeat-containing protein [Candidatus Blautia faecigallinarum]
MGTLEFTITYTETEQPGRNVLQSWEEKLPVDVFYGAYSVTVGTAENGSASASSETAPEGKEITLSASPAEGYHLTGWEVIPDTVAVTDNTFTMPAENVTATPVFTEHTYVWTSNHNGTHNGTCSFSGCGAVLSDQSCDRNGEGGKCSKCGYIASPSVSYWPDVTAAQSVVENYSWTADQSAVTTEEELKAWIEAQLKEMNLNQAAYTVTITDFKEAVEGTAADRDGTDGSFHFTVKLSKGYASVTASVTEGRISAVPYTKWNVEIHAGEGGSVTGSGTFEEGSVVTVRAIPESDRYRFVHWEENGVVVSTSEEYTFTLTADCSLIAVFERIQTEGDITQEQPQITSVKGKLKDGWLHFQVVLSQETEGAEGYEYQSLDSSGKKVLRTKKAASSSCVLKKAPNNIYVRVRAWKTENGKKVYSQWSDPIRMYVKIKAGDMTLKKTSVNGRNVTLTFADNANFFKESDGYDCMLQKTTAGGKTYTRKNQKYRTIQFRNIKPGTYTAKARAYRMVNGKIRPDQAV